MKAMFFLDDATLVDKDEDWKNEDPFNKERLCVLYATVK